MARTKVAVDAAELQRVIDGLEAVTTFKSRNHLWKAVAGTAWAQALGLTPVVVYLRVQEFGLTCRTAQRGQASASVSREDAAPLTTDPTEFWDGAKDSSDSLLTTVSGDFFAPFVRRGIEVRSLGDLITSATKDAALNAAIRAAWCEVRQVEGLPVPSSGSAGGQAAPVQGTSLAIWQAVPTLDDLRQSAFLSK